MPTETLPARFFANARRLGSQIAHHHAAHGQWYPVGWATMARVVRDLAGGLYELGLRPSEAVAIVSETRREWTYTDMAVMATGAVSVGLYPGLSADEYRELLAHCDARICVVDDTRRLAKILAIRDSLPRLRTIVIIESDELSRATAHIVPYDEVLHLGRNSSHDLDACVRALTPLDAATFQYTSGTTGPPKAAMITHGNLSAALHALSAVGVTSSDITLSCLPLPHATARAFEHLGLWLGTQTVYATGRDTLVDDLMAMRPTFLLAWPRTLEDLHGAVYEDMYPLTAGRKLLGWATRIAKHVIRQRRTGQNLAPRLDAQLRLARRLILNRLRTCLGGRIRHVHVGGGAIANDLLYVLEATGVRASTGWSMAETTGVGTSTRAAGASVRSTATPSAVGTPLPGFEFSLAPDGELLVRGPAVFSGYLRDDARTSAVFTTSGHLRTGDLARIGDDGAYEIIGRKGENIVTESGTEIAPRALESLIRADPRISQALVVGHGRPYITALISVRPSIKQIFDDATIFGMVEDLIAAINVDQPRAEQIREFRILPYEPDSQSGELSPSLQLRRDLVLERFEYLIDEMYT